MRILALLLSLIFYLPALSQNPKTQDAVCYNPNLIKDTTKKSIKSMAIGMLGTDSIRISYHSPGVRGRIIWGGLVPFDEVWVTGAHDATNIVIAKPFWVSGIKLPAGKYALFTIPGRNSWTVIINKNWDQHLASEYDESEDIVRVTVKPKKIPHLERLQYFIEPINGTQARIAVAWETIRVEFPITIAGEE